MSLDSSGLEAVFSLTNAKVGCPAFALSSTMYFPMYPVPPIIKPRENFKLNGLIGFKRTRELDYRRGNSQFQTKEVRAPSIQVNIQKPLCLIPSTIFYETTYHSLILLVIGFVTIFRHAVCKGSQTRIYFYNRKRESSC